MPRDTRDSLATEIEATVSLARPDVEVIDVTFLPHQGTVRVMVDHPAGVDHALCREVTELLPSVRERYGVEVSSPGIERPLKKPSHYRRAEGQTVKVRLREPRDGRRTFQGRLVAAEDDSFRLRVDDLDLELPYAAVDTCNIVWDSVNL